MPSIAQVRAAHARNVGTVESPAGSNNVKYNTWYWGHPVSGRGYPWCAAYQSYIWIVECGGDTGLGPKGSASCSVWVAAHKRNGTFGTTPREGAFVFYGPGGGSHIEWVDSVTPSGIWTFGGNTGGSNPYAGGGVWRQFRPYGGSEAIYGYGYPKYDQTPPPVQDQEEEMRPFVIQSNAAGKNAAWLVVSTGSGLIKLLMTDANQTRLPPDGYGPIVKVDDNDVVAIPEPNGAKRS